MGRKRLISKELKNLLRKAQTEKWSKHTGRGFTECEILKTSNRKIFINQGQGLKDAFVYDINDMNRNELETVAKYIRQGRPKKCLLK